MADRKPKAASRALKRLGPLGVVVTIVVVLELIWHPISFFVFDRKYDNVPQYSKREAYATTERAQQILDAFTRPTGTDAIVTSRCGGKAGIEFQYGTHELRVQLEEHLRVRGIWYTGREWTLDGVPVELRNV